ncbi:MAG: GtrA family protein [Myxococcales bacterium]
MTSYRPAQGTAVCIVVPCYNEEARFNSAAFDEHLRSTSFTRFVLVNDGSSDGTLARLNEVSARYPERVRVLDLEINGGKAEAVRQGMLLAFQEPGVKYAGFWDADLATPLDAIEVFADVLTRRADLDIVLGARTKLLGRRIERKASRHYLGRVFATGASITLNLPVYDTQCGAKLFRNAPSCVRLFEKRFGSRWIFDVEILARYLKNGSPETGLYELPVDQWEDVGGSRVKPVDFIRAIAEMAEIYRTYRLPGKGRDILSTLTAPFARYAGAGAIGTVVHYAVLTLAVETGGLSPGAGAALGATFGAAANYLLNYHLTFAASQSHRTTLPRFALVAALGIVVNGLVVKAATANLGLHYLVGQLLATGVVLCLGFVLNKHWTFAKKDLPGQQRANAQAADGRALAAQQSPEPDSDAEAKPNEFTV